MCTSLGRRVLPDLLARLRLARLPQQPRLLREPRLGGLVPRCRRFRFSLMTNETSESEPLADEVTVMTKRDQASYAAPP